jgi:DNA-binding GntR family transcriptional regulator
MGEIRILGAVNRPPTLTAAVASKIRDAILCGMLPAGSPLREVDLSKSLNASRGTIREALRLLQDEDGLVEVLVHRGAYVTALSPHKAWEIYTLRALLEPYAARLGVENHAFCKADLDQLEVLGTRVEDLLRGDDMLETLRTDMEFHRLVCERSGHHLLVSTLQGLRSQTLLFMLNTKLYRSVVSSTSSHLAMVDAIKSGDAARVEETMRKHIVEAGTTLQSRLQEIDWQKMNAS